MLAKSCSTKKIFSLCGPAGISQTGLFLFSTETTRRSYLVSADLMSVTFTSKLRVFPASGLIYHHSLVFDFVDAHGDGLSLRSFRHEHGADLLSVLRNLVFRNLLKGPCRTTFGALQRTGYCWVLMLSAGALELLLGIRPFIE